MGVGVCGGVRERVLSLSTCVSPSREYVSKLEPVPVCVCVGVCVCGWEEGGRKSFRDCGRLVSASSSTRLP